MAQSRNVRSVAAPPTRRAKDGEAERSKRPELKVVAGKAKSSAVSRGVEGLVNWTKARATPMMHIAVAVVFLVASLLGSLLLRTQMIQNSFESTQIQQNITTLTQDVDDDQAKLDELEASLPQKAQDMNMVPATGSLTIDLKGYKAQEDGTKQ